MELTPSTKRSASWKHESSARRTAATSEVTPVAVSLWGDEDGLDLVLRVGPETGRSNSATGTPAPQATSITSTSRPRRSAISTHSVENWPKRAIRTLSPGFKRVGDRRLPGRRAGAGEDEDLARRGAHDALEVREKTQSQLAEIRRAHVLLPDIHRAADLVGDIGRTGNEQMGVTGFSCERLLLAWAWVDHA